MIEIQSVSLDDVAKRAVVRANAEIRSPQWREAMQLVRRRGRASPSVEFNAYLAVEALRKYKQSRREPRLSEDKRELQEAQSLIARLDGVLAAFSTTAANGCRTSPSSLSERHTHFPPIWVARLRLKEILDVVESGQRFIGTLKPDIGGPDQTTKSRAIGSPYERFMVRLIGLYAEVHGASKVTATISERGCYGFIEAVHRYAFPGERLGRETLFKRLLKTIPRG